MEKNTKKEVHIILRITGVLLIFLGILGLLLPVIPGIPLLIIGLLILGEESIITVWIINRLPKTIQEKIFFILKNKKKK